MVGVGVEITTGFVATSLSFSGGEQGQEAGLSGGDESTSTGSSSLTLMSGVEGRDMSRGPAALSSQFFRNLVGVGV